MSNDTKTPEEIEPVDAWWCFHPDCDPDKEMDRDGMKEHVKTVHGIDVAKTMGTRQMVTHMDGDTWFSSVWEWDFGDEVKLRNETHTPRDQDDPMRHV